MREKQVDEGVAVAHRVHAPVRGSSHDRDLHRRQLDRERPVVVFDEMKYLE